VPFGPSWAERLTWTSFPCSLWGYTFLGAYTQVAVECGPHHHHPPHTKHHPEPKLPGTHMHCSITYPKQYPSVANMHGYSSGKAFSRWGNHPILITVCPCTWLQERWVLKSCTANILYVTKALRCARTVSIAQGRLQA
jgi:hypothetical protein